MTGDPVRQRRLLFPPRMVRPQTVVIIAAIFGVFLPSRLFILNHVRSDDSDIELYARYAWVHRRAALQQVSFYDLYCTAGFPGFKAKDSTAMALKIIAYPPLSVAFMTLPAFFARRGVPESSATFSDFVPRYKTIFRRFCAFAELLIVVLVGLLIARLYRNEPVRSTAVRMGVLCAAGFCMPYILYDRLDMILSLLLTASLALLIRGTVYPSFFFFACAINFKLIPLFCAPVWILGSLASTDFAGQTGRKLFTRLCMLMARRGLAIAGITAGVFLFFLFTEGKGALDFLTFHAGRGVHLESTWGSLSLSAARLFGLPFRMESGSGAFEVVSAAGRFFSSLSFPLVTGLVCLLSGLLVFRTFGKFGRLSSGGAVLGPKAVIEAALLFLCVVFSFSKVFSPQFFLVLAPIGALLPLSRRGGLAVLCIFIMSCGLSTAIYPFFYAGAILSGPGPFGLFLLVARSALLLGITGILFARLIASPGSGPAESAGTDGGGGMFGAA